MPGTLTKADIISDIQIKNRYILNRSTEIVETLLEIIKHTLESGEDVMISGFGKFEDPAAPINRDRESSSVRNYVLFLIRSPYEIYIWWSALRNSIGLAVAVQVKDKKERRGRNPATDEDMILPVRRVVTFKCSGRLRDRINGG